MTEEKKHPLVYFQKPLSQLIESVDDEDVKIALLTLNKVYPCCWKKPEISKQTHTEPILDLNLDVCIDRLLYVIDHFPKSRILAWFIGQFCEAIWHAWKVMARRWYITSCPFRKHQAEKQCDRKMPESVEALMKSLSIKHWYVFMNWIIEQEKKLDVDYRSFRRYISLEEFQTEWQGEVMENQLEEREEEFKVLGIDEDIETEIPKAWALMMCTTWREERAQDLEQSPQYWSSDLSANQKKPSLQERCRQMLEGDSGEIKIKTRKRESKEKDVSENTGTKDKECHKRKNFMTEEEIEEEIETATTRKRSKLKESPFVVEIQ